MHVTARSGGKLNYPTYIPSGRPSTYIVRAIQFRWLVGVGYSGIHEQRALANARYRRNFNHRGIVSPFSVNMDAGEVDSEGIANANVLRQQFDARRPEMSVKPVEHGESIVIVGAGAFGSSLALELVTRHRETCHDME
jgi:hypothetical protein